MKYEYKGNDDTLKGFTLEVYPREDIMNGTCMFSYMFYDYLGNVMQSKWLNPEEALVTNNRLRHNGWVVVRRNRNEITPESLVA